MNKRKRILTTTLFLTALSTSTQAQESNLSKADAQKLFNKEAALSSAIVINQKELQDTKAGAHYLMINIAGRIYRFDLPPPHP